MLQIQHICKEYRTGTLVQKALDDVSLSLRDNEFVAILGPSGSGKTTLLNIIGGLDRYDSGDLIINGISTKKYKDRDWDSYRNHTIGFVFQSYNLIPHQTVLANVELALTISGIGKEERKKRAIEALKKVGLGEQLHKRPSQMSGGQMQRVAIARALVNDPDILLADEPTGALDTATSVQVMELLKEVANDRLVVMVTHNPELAEEYATRIVTLKDGKIRSDTDKFYVNEAVMEEPEHKNMGKSSMSFLTALSLSFNNLKTKKARTLLTSFAGSIGIIGIALILALSNGVNAYIKSIEEETLSEYPLQIQSTGFDMTSMMVGNMDSGSGSSDKKETKKDGEVKVMQVMTNMFSTMDSNDLKSLKKYLDSGKSGIEDYTSAVEYSYSISPQIFRQNKDSSARQVNPDKSFEALGIGSGSSTSSLMSSMMSTNVFFEMPKTESLYENQYDVKAGRWPQNYNECVLVLTSDGGISDFLLYTLGLRDQLELDEMIQEFINEKDVNTPADIDNYTYEDILGKTFKLVNVSDCYEYDSQYKVWKDKSDNKEYMKKLVEQGEDLKIVGIVQASKDANASALTPGIGYPQSLTEHVAKEAAKSEIVKDQLENPSKNVFTGEQFGTTEEKNGLDASSLFTVDEDALQKAFGFDDSGLSSDLLSADSLNLENAFQMGGDFLDLSGIINLDQISLDVSGMPQMNLGDMIESLDLTVKPGGMQKLSESIMEGYQEYVKSHPEADYSNLAGDFMDYLMTDEAQKILKDNLQEIIESTGGFKITIDQMQDLVQRVMKGYQKYAAEKGYTDPDKLGEYLAEYLKTEEAKEIMNTWQQEIFGDTVINITSDQLKKLTKELTSSYPAYAAANGKADPTKMGDYFLNYLATADGKQRLMNGLSEVIDMDQLESQLGAAMGSYMAKAMGTYTGAISDVLETKITSAMNQIVTQITGGIGNAMQAAMGNVGNQLQNMLGSSMKIDTDAFAKAFQMNMTEDDLKELMTSMTMSATASYDNNLKKLGYADFADPSQISIYPTDFESKEEVVKILDSYNSRMEKEGKEEQVITYTDIVGTLMSSVTNIVDIISYVLIAFVAISLVVSSIMIGVITYISVLERKKEIGILRAIGASKRNVSQVFNAETVIIGLCAGLIGIGLSLLLLIPGNMIIHAVANNNKINAFLPVLPAIVLILLSIGLTLLGGIIPSRKAAKNDPVTALRTE
ncbi:ABC transporter ATP-binding protein/permease [Coprococcus comes]|jgi:putative ABC transport system permease protein|uniref:ATP-binding cassette domain-containing protein n=1 Tax=Coprococcus comes TaxID=410072 RepID=A0A3R6BQM8_9FIRM|nr:ABC transporter ATP-binding protein/permease [Coprococcus comes]RGU41790.1 ATP-binding cassette domain-containing protein [Coprococcus comes]